MFFHDRIIPGIWLYLNMSIFQYRQIFVLVHPAVEFLLIYINSLKQSLHNHVVQQNTKKTKHWASKSTYGNKTRKNLALSCSPEVVLPLRLALGLVVCFRFLIRSLNRRKKVLNLFCAIALGLTHIISPFMFGQHAIRTFLHVSCRSSPVTSHLPRILLSALCDCFSESLCRTLGHSGFV